MGGPDGGMPGGGGGMPGGGGGFGGGLDELGAPGGEEEGDISGNEGAEPTGDMGGGAPPEGGTPPPPPANEGKKSKKVLTESKAKQILAEKNKILDNMFETYLNKIDNRIERSKKQESIIERTDIYDKSLLINEEFSKMIDSLNFLNNEEEADE